MICNKKDWKVLDEIQVVLSKFAPMMDERDKARVNALISLCAEATQKERASRDRTYAAIKEHRKTNPKYGRWNYEARKGAARQEAKDWQNDFANHDYSYEELGEFNARFEKLAKQFGLQKEFKENGII